MCSRLLCTGGDLEWGLAACVRRLCGGDSDLDLERDFRVELECPCLTPGDFDLVRDLLELGLLGSCLLCGDFDRERDRFLDDFEWLE